MGNIVNFGKKYRKNNWRSTRINPNKTYRIIDRIETNVEKEYEIGSLLRVDPNQIYLYRESILEPEEIADILSVDNNLTQLGYFLGTMGGHVAISYPIIDDLETFIAMSSQTYEYEGETINLMRSAAQSYEVILGNNKRGKSSFVLNHLRNCTKLDGSFPDSQRLEQAHDELWNTHNLLKQITA